MLEQKGAPTADDQHRMIQQIKDLCEKLKVSDDVQQLAILFVQRVIDKSLTNRRNPRSVPAACLYLACEMLQKPKSQVQVSQAASIADGTLRTIVGELRRKISELYPEKASTHAASSSQDSSLILDSSYNNLSQDGSRNSIHRPATPKALQSRQPSATARPTPSAPQQSIRNFFSSIPSSPILEASQNPLPNNPRYSNAPAAQRALFPEDSNTSEVPPAIGTFAPHHMAFISSLSELHPSVPEGTPAQKRKTNSDSEDPHSSDAPNAKRTKLMEDLEDKDQSKQS